MVLGGFGRSFQLLAERRITTAYCDENPLIVTWQFGKGRAMAFATDCSPHWAEYFQPWEYYGQFWRQAVRWLAGEI